MQIEFYLPLPPEGFWSGLMIYYMAGLFVCLYQSIDDYSSAAHSRAFDGFSDIAGCVCLAVIAFIWPWCLYDYYRKR